MLAHPTPKRATRILAAALVTLTAGGVAVAAWAAQPPRAVQASTANPLSIVADQVKIEGSGAATWTGNVVVKAAGATLHAAKVTADPPARAVAETASTVKLAQASNVVALPDWMARPSGEDLVRFYPPEALKASLSGMARLECTVVADGHLTDCSVGTESPADAGFGEAALQLAPYFQMKPISRDGVAVAGSHVVIPIRFAIN